MTEILNDNILLLEKSQEFKEHLINEAIKALSILQKPIISINLTTPPTSPNEDDFYIVPSGATGAWSGKTNKIAYPAVNTLGAITGWNFYEPFEGLHSWLIGTGLVFFDGTDWQTIDIGLGGGILPSQTGEDGKYLKTISGVSLWSSIQNELFSSLKLGETTTPSTGADEIKLYVKSDQRIYYRKESDGNEHLLKEDDVIPFFIPTPVNGLVVKYRNKGNAKILVSANHQTDSGTATFSVSINGTNVTGLTSISSSTSDTDTTATAANTIATGALVVITYGAVTSPINSRIQLYLRDS